ncbi:8728_t:CDS:2, partial [Ambispora gerdemannii]
MRSIAPSKRRYIMPEFKVPFPPEITPMNLIEKAIARLETNGKISRIPNAFIAYRMAFYKELRTIKHPVITQPQLSTLVKQSWLKEEEHVQREYQRSEKEANDLYIQICRERNFVFSNSSNLSDSNFDFFNNNEISSLSSSVTKDQQLDSYENTASTTPNVTNISIFNTDNLTPDLLISQSLDLPSIP